ncbi:MAG TPA: hypothetical protein VNU97_05060 [Rhizomicrobium sp.]|jgi:hypothetical protein|nr:hypothetical protein [Rhizomicrobium sp.]
MTTLNPPASGQMPAQPAENPDEALRRLAGKRLAEYLDIGVGLATECSRLASARKRDHLGPITAAARLFNSNARVAQALALVALVERRQRTIVERIQPPKPDPAQLNSTNERKEDPEEIRRRLEPRILGIVARIQARDQPSNPHAEAHARATEEWEAEGNDPYPP